jgi:hypothetical protein
MFHNLNNYLINLSVFEKGSVLDGISSETYLRYEDGSSVIVKFVFGLRSMESLRIEIENQLNLYTDGFYFSDKIYCARGIKDCSIICGRQFVDRSDFRESSVVDSNSESENSCKDCAESSICTQSWINPRSSTLD